MRYSIVRRGLFHWAIHDNERRQLHSEMGHVERFFLRRNAERKIQSLIWQSEQTGKNHPYNDIG